MFFSWVNMHGQDSYKNIIFLLQVVRLGKHSSADTFIKRTGVWRKQLLWANSEVKTTSMGGQCQQDSNDILACKVYKTCFELTSRTRGSIASYRKTWVEGSDPGRSGFGRNSKYFWRENLFISWICFSFFRKKAAILRLSVTQALSLNLTDHKITLLKKRDSEENPSCGCMFSDCDLSAKACGTKWSLSSLQRQGCVLVKRLSNARLWPGHFMQRSTSVSLYSFEKQCWERLLWSRCAVYAS